LWQAVLYMCGGLQYRMDLGKTEPSVRSVTGVTVTAGGSEVSDVRSDSEVLQTQEENRLTVALPAVKAAHRVRYVCNIVLLTVVQVCTVASAFWQRVVWCLGVTVQ
jgi:hypothetical protein